LSLERIAVLVAALLIRVQYQQIVRKTLAILLMSCIYIQQAHHSAEKCSRQQLKLYNKTKAEGGGNIAHYRKGNKDYGKTINQW
jgi:hypothetical protein